MLKIGPFLKGCFGDKNTLKENVIVVLTLLVPYIKWLVGCLFVFFVFSNFCGIHSQRIGTVNITGIVDGFVKTQVALKLEPKVLNERVKSFGKNLEVTLHAVAKKEGVVLMPAEAVIAGGEDYTPMVNKLLTEAAAK